jgi:hypothetical protein
VVSTNTGFDQVLCRVNSVAAQHAQIHQDHVRQQVHRPGWEKLTVACAGLTRSTSYRLVRPGRCRPRWLAAGTVVLELRPGLV